MVACGAVLALLWPIAIFVLHHPALSSVALRVNGIVFILLWALGPAIWFSVEWHFWGNDAGFARGQQYARDFWLGAGAIVLLFAAQALTPGQTATASHSVISWDLVVQVVKAGLWPLVVVIGFVLFRDSIRACLSAIGMRASKFSAFSFTIELASLPDAQPWSGPVLDDLKSEFALETLDSSGSLFEAIKDTTPVDYTTPVEYATVDLEDGKAWLTSRLFILAALIPRVRPIQRIVFVCNAAKRFLGECSVTAVAEALAKRYPHLEEEYLRINVSAAQSNGKTQLNLRRSMLGPMAPGEATQMLSQFLLAVRNGGVTGTPGWTSLGRYVEHAEWITNSLIIELSDKRLNTVPVTRDTSEDGTFAARILLQRAQDYVAIVGIDGRFLRLVDRRKAIDQVIRPVLARTP